VPAVQTLRRVWLQQFYAGEPIRWRKADDLPPAPLLISSPYDPDARYSRKRETEWTGYKVQCDSFSRNRPVMVGGWEAGKEATPILTT
jgi:transposase